MKEDQAESAPPSSKIPTKSQRHEDSQKMGKLPKIALLRKPRNHIIRGLKMINI
jgi:hypothetical protein